MSIEHRRNYWLGCLSGLSAAAGLVLTWFAFSFSHHKEAFGEFHAEIPTITKLVTQPFYLKAMPIAVLAAVLLGNMWVKKPNRLLALLVVTTVVGVVAVVVGYWGVTLPMRELVGNISAK